MARGRILRRISLAATVGIAALVLSGCSIDNSVLRFGWPSGITPEAHKMRELWTWSVIAALVLGVIMWGLMFWTITFHRRKKNETEEFPKQFGYNVALELFCTAVPFVVIAVLFYFTVIVQNDVMHKQDNPDVVVDVTGYQWNWQFGYREVVGADGQRQSFVDEEATAAAERQEHATEEETSAEDHHEATGPIYGRSTEDLSYLHYDTIETVGTSYEIPVLVLPTGKRIEFELASADVVHSFWVPDFLFKRDVNPNPYNNASDPVFQISEIEREGAFVGRCAEMCGTFHAMMNFEVRAVSPEKFDQYIALRKPTTDGGQGLSNAEALSAIGESPVAISTSPFTTDRTSRAASGE